MKTYLGAACVTAALFLSAVSAQAATIYQSNFQGATFTLTQNSATSVTFDIAGVDALSGNWSSAQYLGAFAFKGLGASALTSTLTGGGPSVNAAEGGLSAGGCNGNGSGFVCFDYAPNIAIAGKTRLTFDLIATSGTFDLADDGPHLKILWSSKAGKDQKVGDLYSQAIPVSAVPEPATWAMMIMGLGLAGSAIRRRRRDPAIA